MTLAAWFSVILLCALGAMSPGPSLAVVLSQTLQNGRGHGLITAWCHATGVALWAGVTVVGVAAFITHNPLLSTALSWGGAFYLCWLGHQSFSAARGAAFVPSATIRVSCWRAGLDGALISLLNPKLALFFLALFSQFVVAEAPFRDHLVLVLTAFMVDGLWYTLVALVLSRGVLLTGLQSYSPAIHRGLGVLFILLALWVVLV